MNVRPPEIEHDMVDAGLADPRQLRSTAPTVAMSSSPRGDTTTWSPSG